MSNQVSVITEVRTALTAMTPQFQAALPRHVSVEKFNRIAMTAIQGSPKLLECDRRTLFSACMKAAQDGLLPDGREGAIVPRKGVASWQPMVAGIMKKVRNSGEISTWSVHTVHENDEFDYILGDEEKIIHRPARKSRGEIIGAYSIVLMKDGERSREYMDTEEIHAIRDRSDGYKYAKSKGGDNPWITDPGEMYKKTVIRRHSKRLPMSTDLDELLRADDEQFMPAEPEPQAAQAAEVKPKGRASRLASVAEQAPQTPAPDDDGVIDMAPSAPIDDAGDAQTTGNDDSPI